MLPDTCQESRGSVKSIFSTMLDCWAKCTLGYQEPNEVRMSAKTVCVFFNDLIPVHFRDAKIIVDESIADGIVELHNSQKQNNPLYNGRVIFNDFPGPVEFTENP